MIITQRLLEEPPQIIPSSVGKARRLPSGRGTLKENARPTETQEFLAAAESSAPDPRVRVHSDAAWKQSRVQN